MESEAMGAMLFMNINPIITETPESWLKFIPGAAYVTDAEGFLALYNEASVAPLGT